MAPRIALLGFSIECNRFAPIASEADFSARSPAPRMLAELPGFIADMDAAGPWVPVPITLAMTAPNGPVDQDFFAHFWRSLPQDCANPGRWTLSIACYTVRG